jgi:hypothetical protein
MAGASSLAELTSEQLLTELASIDRRQQPRRLAALRAELARRGVRYREKALGSGAVTPYEVVLLENMAAPKIPGPLIRQVSAGAQLSWWHSLLLVALLIAGSLLLRLADARFQPQWWWPYAVMLVVFCLTECWLLHSRLHHDYLAVWLQSDEGQRASRARQRLLLYTLALLFGLMLSTPAGFLLHQWTARPLTQQVLLADMRRDYNSDCRFQVLLQFEGGQYRALCLQSEADYDQLRPNDQRWFVGDWSALGIRGTLTTGSALAAPLQQKATGTD